MIKVYEVPDYEHKGDLDYAIAELKDLCSDIKILESWQERDFEAEHDYKEDYSDEDFEPIYKGFVKYEVPNDKVYLLNNL